VCVGALLAAWLKMERIVVDGREAGRGARTKHLRRKCAPSLCSFIARAANELFQGNNRIRICKRFDLLSASLHNAGTWGEISVRINFEFILFLTPK